MPAELFYVPQGCRFRAVRCLRFSGRVSLSVRFLHLTGKVAQKYDKANGALVRESGAKTACRWGWDGDFCSLDTKRAFHTVQRRGGPSHKAAKESSIFFIAMLY